MGIRGKRVDDPHPFLGEGIGAVDNAQWRLSARDQGKRGAHVFGSRKLLFNAGPDTERFECALAVFAGGNAVGIRDRQALVAKRRRQSESADHLEVDVARRRRNQHQRVA
jgi:hypothetical protein